MFREVERRRHISDKNHDMRERRISGMSDMTGATMGGMSSVSSYMSGRLVTLPLLVIHRVRQCAFCWPGGARRSL